MAPKSCSLKTSFFAFDFFNICGHHILDYASPTYVKIWGSWFTKWHKFLNRQEDERVCNLWGNMDIVVTTTFGRLWCLLGGGEARGASISLALHSGCPVREEKRIRMCSEAHTCRGRSKPPCNCLSPMKSMKVKPECINSVQVVQADGKVISICMDPTKQIDFSLCQNSKFGSCRVKNRQDGPMSIAVNLSPSNHVPVHAAFNTVADRKEANIIQRAKDKLAWKICYNPQGQNRLGQNVLVEMNGGTLQDRLGDPDSSTCLLQLHDKPSNRKRLLALQGCCLCLVH